MNRILVTLTAAASLWLAGSAHAEATTPVGLWKTYAEDGKTAQSLVRIVESDGRLSGRIEKLLDPARQDARCDKCLGELQGRSLLGLEILHGLRADGADKSSWAGGVLVDPNTGRFFRASVKTLDGGQKLQARGSLGPLSRAQTWERVE
jgi:uncharacterized protein (DUF2147 family)